jgi:hypothetical protein
MLEYWTERSQTPIRSTAEDTKTLTLNVLAAALFNREYAFEGGAEKSKTPKRDDKSYVYRDSLSTIMSSIIQVFILGEEGLKAWWTPESWKRAAEAVATFRLYILGLIDEERAHLKQGQTHNQHLVARLVRACELEGLADDNLDKPMDGDDTSKKVNMTEQEIISNLFVYAFAGNDTTAIALTNLIVHMSANPQTQDWIAEELQHYLPNDDPDSWTYDKFRNLKRCRAVVVSNISSEWPTMDRELTMPRWKRCGYATHFPSLSKLLVPLHSPWCSVIRHTSSPLGLRCIVLFQRFMRTQNTGVPILSHGSRSNISAPPTTITRDLLRTRF